MAAAAVVENRALNSSCCCEGDSSGHTYNAERLSQEALRGGMFEVRWYAVLVAGRQWWAGEWPREFVLEESEVDRRSGRRITMFCFVFFVSRY